MADQKISELTALTGANVADDDAIAIVDTSATETKKIVFSELKNALDTATGFVRITGDTMTGDLSMGDNVKAIFGAGSDLQIYSDGTTGQLVGNVNVTGNTESDTVTIGISSVAGTEKLRVNGTVLTLGGSVSAPAIGVGDTNTGVYAPSAGQLGWTVNGTQRLFLDSTGIDVTGTVTADGLTVDGANINIDNGYGYTWGSNAVQIYSNGSYLRARTSSTDRLQIASNGDISFYEDTGTTPKMVWKSADERLGIGTSSPSAPLTVDTGAGTFEVKAKGSGSVTLASDASLTYFGSTHEFYNAAGTTTHAVIDSSGNVGIGDSPTFNLSVIRDTSEVYSSTGFPNATGHFKKYNNSGLANEYSSIRLQVSANNGSTNAQAAITAIKPSNTTNATDLAFQTRNAGGSISEAMRIDSSGNLLVGTTNSTPGIGDTDDGAVLGAAGWGFFSKTYSSADTSGVLYVGRNGTDGNIINIAKDGAPVGSIKTKSDRFAITDNAYGGIVFASGGNAVLPAVNDGTPTNNTVDLGNSLYGWRDLYLSGGVVFGSTGGSVTSKTLDDYETGTWTPTIVASTTNPTVTYSANRYGSYVKVGNLVTVNCYVDTTAFSGGSGNLQVGNLPFASTTATTLYQAAGSCSFAREIGTTAGIVRIGKGVSVVDFIKTSDGTSLTTTSDVTGGPDIHFTITYRTD